MANVVDLALFKQHVKADDFADDDLLKSATGHVIRATNRTEAELTEMGGGEFPAELQQAIMMLGAHWYNQRESNAQTIMPEVANSLQAIIKPFRKLVKDDSGTDEI